MAFRSIAAGLVVFGVLLAAITLPLRAAPAVQATTQRVTCPASVSIHVIDANTVDVLCDATGATAVPTAASTALPTSAATSVATNAPTSNPTSIPATPLPTVAPPPAGSGIWLSPAEIADLPTAGAAWDQLLGAANGSWGSPNLSDLNSNHDVLTLAGALVCAKLRGSAMCQKTASAIHSAIGTESSSRGLEVSRNITSYVIAADLIGYRDAGFVSWLSALRSKPMTDGRTIISTQEDRPNNWGSMASAARVAIDAYLGDATDLNRAATVFHGLMGDRASYSGFAYGDLSWQCTPAAPVGINPLGCLKNGHIIDGVIPDDQRRSGAFAWPPPCGTYPWESLQGITIAAQLLSRQGYPAWDWNDRAILRSYQWLYTNGCPPTGDDRGYPWLVNHAYGTIFAAISPAPSGKNAGYLDWVFGP